MYDYIIVGGGTAGATAAKILSDSRKNSVLLLEAGEDNDNDKPITNSTFAPYCKLCFINISKVFRRYAFQFPQKLLSKAFGIPLINGSIFYALSSLSM